MTQGKAHAAGNGKPFPRGATQHWLISDAPSGPAHKPRWPRYTRWNWRRPVLHSRALPTRLVDWLWVTELPAWTTSSRLRLLRSCDLVPIRFADVAHAGWVLSRATVTQGKTGLPIRFELTEHTREAVQTWMMAKDLGTGDYLFPSRVAKSRHISTRHYARIVDSWVALIGLDHHEYGTHSLRRTKATLISRRTKNLRAVQLLLGHTELESTIRYLGIEVDDALELAEHTDI